MVARLVTHRTDAEQALLGDGLGNVRIFGTDDIVCRLYNPATATYRVITAELSRLFTGEASLQSGVLVTPETPQTITAMAEGNPILVVRMTGRAPTKWRVLESSLTFF
jgi:hypothetical protein